MKVPSIPFCPDTQPWNCVTFLRNITQNNKAIIVTIIISDTWRKYFREGWPTSRWYNYSYWFRKGKSTDTRGCTTLYHWMWKFIEINSFEVIQQPLLPYYQVLGLIYSCFVSQQRKLPGRSTCSNSHEDSSE